MPIGSITYKQTLPATLDQLAHVSDQIAEILAGIDDIPDAEIVRYNIQLAVQEICVNIVTHAYKDIPAGQIAITIALQEHPRQLVIELNDTGHRFEPQQVPLPDLSTVREHGYGLFLAHSLLDTLCYTSTEHANTWYLTKNI